MIIYNEILVNLNKLRKKQDNNITIIYNVIKQEIEKFQEKAFWESFGFVVYGIFYIDKIEKEQLLKDLIEKPYARSIILASYFDSDLETSCCIEIITNIKKGKERFKEWYQDKYLSKESKKIFRNIIIDYLEYNIGRFEECQLWGLYHEEIINGNTYRIPVNKTGRMHFGIINPWPGDLSAESEVVTRLNVSAEEAGIKCTLLSDWGHILDKKSQKKTSIFTNAVDMDFVITTHYLSPKAMDSFYYHALWNPPEIPLNLGEYNQYITNNYIMNDDFLTYDLGGMKNHLKTVLLNKPRDIENTSLLTASFPESSMLSPKLNNPKMFYCGMNWDKLVHNQNRHAGLFERLDQTKKVSFFGPDIMKNWGGIRPWEGYKCYCGPIPWDGFSILKEINKCGICLVISSDVHRRAGAVTNRAYEACAAGAIMISDNNAFMQKYFSDAALFIYYNRNDPEDTFRQIMEKYEWIINHPNETLKLIERAQKIFKDNFALDKQLLKIVENHYKRFRTISKSLLAKSNEKLVLVTYVLNSIDEAVIKDKLDIIINNIKRQYYTNIRLVVATDSTVVDFTKKYLNENLSSADVLELGLFDQKGIRYMVDGTAIREIQKKYIYDYYINTSARENWFYDHISSLVRSIEDSKAYGAYSGRLFWSSDDGYIRMDRFDVFSDAELASMSDARTAETPGQFMFTRETQNFIVDYLMDLMDGMEHYAYMNLLQIKYGKELCFSKRMTIVDDGFVYDDRKQVIPYAMQVRCLQDLIRFELKYRKSGGESLSFNPLGQSYPDCTRIIKDNMLKFPVKLWIKYKINLVLAKIMGVNTSRGNKYIGRAMQIKNKFFENWG